jgi:hypothetical protein
VVDDSAEATKVHVTVGGHSAAQAVGK